jgi:regulator of RNase E activity RraA
VVLPGDLLVGDADGLLAIRADEAPAIAARVRAIAAAEARVLEDIARGTLDRAWVDATLTARGVL